MWQYHQKMAHLVFGHPKFPQFLVKMVWEKIESGLISIVGTVGVALAWFFYLLTKNLHVLSKIREELDSMIAQVQYHHTHDDVTWNRCKILSRNFQDLKDKSYPPVPFDTRVPIEPETLPSGHKVDSSMQIIFNMYAMGWMKSLWGEDCHEFKPERWILETGKNIALTMMKVATIAITSRYHVEPAKAHPMAPNTAMVVHMKQGFKVKVATY
ncbi:hypothetical protein Cgig2_033567 [Carnegiea gigantea]|uniref:Uncharacterized protein n=1 Tax=Carnegiea gigantea TaxID=171969 RepID=A0A9Q1QLD9_9CARY|nr:hypothetical protein Cgig2_033567 [Carnegiea gigantea]